MGFVKYDLLASSRLSLSIKFPRRGRYCVVLWVGVCAPDEGMWF